MRLTVTFLVLFWSINGLCKQQDYFPLSHKEIEQRINYLERVVFEPLDANSEIWKLGLESQEFMLFTYAYSTYALTNLAIRDSSYKQRAQSIIFECIQKALQEDICSTYGLQSPKSSNAKLAQKGSILYFGHLNLMLGCYRLISTDTAFNLLHDHISANLNKRYLSINYLNLQSYPEAIWIPDNTVAMASLKLHDASTRTSYFETCQAWVNFAQANYLHPKTDVLFATISSESGAPLEEPRGSMLGWSIFFIYQFDPHFAKQQYLHYKKHFSTNFVFIRLFKERYKVRNTSAGDIDSGPILFGYSLPANEFALSNAVLSQDKGSSRKLHRLIKLGTRKKRSNNELKYKVRFLKFNISPMAEALVLCSLTAILWDP